jgi:NAD(P)-dependent dehydrogenase (short-subunit alcohol dehydrogenase family)
MPLLDGKTAVVTGGASGIGRGISQRLAEEGADVVVADVREEPRLDGSPTHEWIEEETDASAAYCYCDVTEVDDIVDAIETAEEFGEFDTMVNNAGVTGPMGPFYESSFDAYHDALDVLLHGVYRGSKLAATKMLDEGTEGSIVNLSSAAGIEGYGGLAPYSAAKGGVRLLTYAMADDLGPDIRVNAVHPGLTETAMASEDAGMVGTEIEDEILADTPLSRLADPREIADAVVYLASDMASYVTGTSILVDGGLTNTA